MAKNRIRARTKRQNISLSPRWIPNTAFRALGAFLALGLALFATLQSRRVPAGKPIIPKREAPGRLWRIVDTENGKGVIATRFIPVGSLIILDLPLVTLGSEENRTSAGVSLINSLNRMSGADKAEFFSLSFVESKMPTDSPPENRIVDLALNIFESNAVRTGNSSAIYPNACRINHSCLPNADYVYRDDLDALTVQALTNISEGEEILAPYFDASGHTHGDRQEYLKDAYGFQCKCKACSLNEAERVESDRRRARIGEIREKIIGWSEETVEPEEAISGIEEALQLLEEEQYFASIGSWSANAVQISAAHQDADSVRKWALRAAVRYAIESGKDSPQMSSVSRVYENPEAAQAWGKRDARVL